MKNQFEIYKRPKKVKRLITKQEAFEYRYDVQHRLSPNSGQLSEKSYFSDQLTNN